MGALCCGGPKGDKNYKRTTAKYQDLIKTYKIDSVRLGKGSFGTVYKGTNRQNSKNQLAVKKIDKRYITKEEIDDIHNEVMILGRMDHSNIVNYFETYDDNNNIYLCMELCTGGELVEVISKDKKKFTEDEVSKIIYSLLEALSYIHAQKIIHRDIKPENIMFDQPGGTVKFIDFGLATQMNQQMDIAGTPYYLAPEVLTKKYGTECDIWSLGVVLYQMISGKFPFDGRSQFDLFKNIKTKQPKYPSFFSADLIDLLKKML